MNVGMIGGAEGPTQILVSAAEVTQVSGGMLAGFIVLAMAIGYLLGSLEFGIIVSKFLYGDDVRNHGSGNAGMTNVLRTFGKKAAALVLVGDMGKGILSVILIRTLAQSFCYTAYPNGVDLGAVAAFFAVIGHLFPLFFGFKGGKGVAVASGTILVTNPMVFLGILLVFLIVVGFTRIVSLASILGAVCYPIFTLIYCLVFQQNPLVNTLFAACMAGLVIFMHRANIQRLRQGTEYRFGQKK